MIHAITATRAFDEAKKREAASRLCPNCRSEETAEKEKLNNPVSCKKCGGEIPQTVGQRRRKRQPTIEK